MLNIVVQGNRAVIYNVFSEFISQKVYVILFNNFIKSCHYNFISLISQEINKVLSKVKHYINFLEGD